MKDVLRHQAEGWGFRKTRLSDRFGFDDAKDRLPDDGEMLLIVGPNGSLRFFTHASQPRPRPGDTIIAYSPRPARSAEEAAAKNAAKRSPRAAPPAEAAT